MKKYVCIHGHFYQPPREDPWMKRIESQPSAYPAHDWNERVHHECYRPNAFAEILDDRGQVVERRNNYEYINFNFGPTILSWMEKEDPEVFQKIVDGDRESRKRFGGHGSALAQVYNHIILPLASERDKRLQVEWGLKDFSKRFGRDAEGIWLAEAAVDVATLEVLAEFGVKFTILSPDQALSKNLDLRIPYRFPLPSGKSITLFFYDAEVSRSVAFNGLLHDGKKLADHLIKVVGGHSATPQLAFIATDGESYGHHHRRGEMALAYALKVLESDSNIQLTNLAQFLALHPAQQTVEIHNPSSWSCAHGVERWRSNCGCRVGTQILDQSWRTPLRESLNELKNSMASIVDQKLNGRQNLLRDMPLILDGNRPQELAADPNRSSLLHVLELERKSHYMMTSCAWFFDSANGIEVRQNLKFAARALDLLQQLGVSTESLEKSFLQKLSQAKTLDQKDLAEFFRAEILASKKTLVELFAQAFLSERLQLDLRGSSKFSFAFDQCFVASEHPRDLELWNGRFQDLENDDVLETKFAFRNSERRPRVILRKEGAVSESDLAQLSMAISPESFLEFGIDSLGNEGERALFRERLEQVWTDWSQDFPQLLKPRESKTDSDPIWNLAQGIRDFLQQ
jgi:hypothetical protein